MMESNYPYLLSRNVGEKSQYGPELGLCMVLGEKCWLASLFATLINCLRASAVVTEGDRWRCPLA